MYRVQKTTCSTPAASGQQSSTRGVDFILQQIVLQTSQWVSLDGAKGFRMKIELTAGDLIRGLMAQDPIHVVKKIDCKLDSAKVLELGFYTCVHGHLLRVSKKCLSKEINSKKYYCR